MTGPVRVLVTKIGLDGHDRGSRLVAGFLKNAGMEVIYTSPWQTVDSVCAVAVQEDVAVIGISTLATDHLLVPKLMEKLSAAGLGDVGVVVGGIVPDEEQPALIAAGVSSVLGPGASEDEIVTAITSAAGRKLAEGVAS